MRVEALCVGHASYDLCMIVDGYPEENSKAETELLIEAGGGPAANAAWLLSHWGVPTAMAALVGDDDYGRRAAAELRQEGVECQLMELRAGHVTPVSFVIANRAGGSRTIINRKAPTARLALAREDLGGMAPRLLLFDGHELNASLAAMEAFPSAITVLDAGSPRAGALELARRVDHLVCSERFAVHVTGEKDVWANRHSCLRRLRELNGKVAVVTLGERGLIFDDGRRQGEVPALAVKAVDSSAAGDIFHGAYAYALLQGMGLDEALRLATAAAGLSVQQLGARTSMPDLSAVLAALPAG